MVKQGYHWHLIYLLKLVGILMILNLKVKLAEQASL